MDLVGVEMDVEGAVLGKQLVHEDQPLAKELDELSALDLVAVGPLSALSPKLAFGGERRVDVAEADAWTPIAVAKLAATLHLEQRLQHLHVVAEDQFVGPVRVAAEALQRLQRHAHRPRQDDSARLLAGVAELGLLLAREQPVPPVVRQELVRVQPRDDVVALAGLEPWTGSGLTHLPDP